MKNQIKRLDRVLRYEGAIVDFYSDFMEMPDKSVAIWDYVAHRKGASAAVCVMPNGKLLMVRQYRNAIGRDTIEIPAGARDSVDEDFKVCALRELEEETGYHANKIEYLISLKTTVAFCNEQIEVFVASDVEKTAQNLDEDEYIELEEFELSELLDMIYNGEIQDSKTVSSILAYAIKVGAK